MTYLEAALVVLRRMTGSMTVREVTAEAIKQGLINPGGKTPEASMSAALYTSLGRYPALVKLDRPGAGRAARGSVQWTVREE